jgi:hypothetical protein
MFFVFITVSLAMIFLFQALRRAENCKQLLLALAAGLAASSPFAPVYVDIWLSRSAHASAMRNPLLFASQVYSDYIATPLRSAWPFLVGLLVVSVAYFVYATEGRHRVVVVTTALASVLVDYFFFYYRPMDLAEACKEFFAKIYRKNPRDIMLKVIGAQPGEKIHEELMTYDEAIMARDLGDYIVLDPYPHREEPHLTSGGKRMLASNLAPRASKREILTILSELYDQDSVHRGTG